jgi:hypothetical protein
VDCHTPHACCYKLLHYSPGKCCILKEGLSKYTLLPAANTSRWYLHWACFGLKRTSIIVVAFSLAVKETEDYVEKNMLITT